MELEKLTHILDADYKEWLTSIKKEYRRSQIKAATKVNIELVSFNWRLGRSIVLMRAEAKWGSRFFDVLSRDLKDLLPESQGFSPRNIRYMERFYRLFPAEPILQNGENEDENEIVPQVGAKITTAHVLPFMGENLNENEHENNDLVIFSSGAPKAGEEVFRLPWNHIKTIIDKCGEDSRKALFYIHESIKNNWSRAVLLNFLGTNLYERSGRAITNFPTAMPEYRGDLAAEITRDPYNFDFLVIRKDYDERSLKDALIANIEKFLLELGTGFSYIGREYRLKVGQTEIFCDMLFYNTTAHAYVVVEVKVKDFQPGDIGQLGTYVVAVDHLLRSETDNKTIGLLICKGKSEIMARYALESVSQPLGISSYELSSLIPESYESSMPTIEEIESVAGEGLESSRGLNEIGEAVKNRRKEIGMTQQELAVLCKMTQPTIAKIENGLVSPNLRNIKKICKALGLKIKIES